MLNKQFVLSFFAVFVTLSVFGFVVWGLLLPESFYAAVGLNWRGEGDEHMAWIVISDVIKAFVLVWLFGFGFEGKGIGEGLRFGFFAGLLFATPNLVTYAVQPVAFDSTLYMFAINLVSIVVAGLVLALVYKKGD